MSSLPPSGSHPAAKTKWRHRAALMLAMVAVAGSATGAAAKKPGHTYCFFGICHRVMTLAETAAEIGKILTLQASHYDDCKHDRFNPCGLTSSGAVFRPDMPDNAASPIYPDGTVILARHPKTRKSAVLRINSAGPYHGKRTLDVSRAAARELGFARHGVATLEVRVLKSPSKGEASYHKNRVYTAVPGPIGTFASIDDATARYADLNPGDTALAALVPQHQGGSAPQPANAGDGNPLTASPATMASFVSNGLERTWLAKAMTFKPSAKEARVNRQTVVKLARLEHRHGAKQPRHNPQTSQRSTTRGNATS